MHWQAMVGKPLDLARMCEDSSTPHILQIVFGVDRRGRVDPLPEKRRKISFKLWQVVLR